MQLTGDSGLGSNSDFCTACLCFSYSHFILVLLLLLLARDVIYTSRAYAMMPVRLSVTEVHWRIIANLGFKFRFHFTARVRRPCCLRVDHLVPC